VNAPAALHSEDRQAADPPLTATTDLTAAGPELTTGPGLTASSYLPEGLAVLASSTWPAAEHAELPAIPGFIVSSFSPLAAAVAELCLLSYFGPRPADQDQGESTAIVLASGTGDIATAAAIASAVDEGRRVPPLLFFQSNPNAVVGYIAARWGLAGPVICTNPIGDILADAMLSATLLIEDAAATAVLVILADTDRDGADRGAAMLIGPASWQLAHPASGTASGPQADAARPGQAAKAGEPQR